jgi:hypothetical protein
MIFLITDWEESCDTSDFFLILGFIINKSGFYTDRSLYRTKDEIMFAQHKAISFCIRSDLFQSAE